MRAGSLSKPPLPPVSDAPRGRPRRAAAPVSKHLEAFLEMMAAERGAAPLTLAAYKNDLTDLSSFLSTRGVALEAANAEALHSYVTSAATTRLTPRTLA